MLRIRVLVVDDSVVVRRVVSDVLSEDPAIEVAGTAPNGRIALAKIDQLNPDIVTLDIEMPELDGLETLKAIRKTRPALPVIMFSTLTARGAEATLDALALGANDYVTKPANVGKLAEAMQRIREELTPKVKALLGRRVQVAPQEPVHKQVKAPERSKPRSKRVDIVAIGVSTGGPNALAEVVPALPADLPVPVVIVQHMPPLFTQFLAERLAAKTDLEVREGQHDAQLSPGAIWIAPGDRHMEVHRNGGEPSLRLTDAPPENSCRPAVDVLFRSVAQAYGGNTLALVLTGMGQDGHRGCEWMRQAGGQIVVQDEATSVVWGMPGFVARAGLADAVTPLCDIAAAITDRVDRGRRARKTALRT